MKQIHLFAFLSILFLLIGCGDQEQQKAQEEKEVKSFTFLNFFSFLNQKTETETLNYKYKYSLTSVGMATSQACTSLGQELYNFLKNETVSDSNIFCKATGLFFKKYYLEGTFSTEGEISLTGTSLQNKIFLTLTDKIPLTPVCPGAITNEFKSKYSLNGFLYAPLSQRKTMTGSIEIWKEDNTYYSKLLQLKVDGQLSQSELLAEKTWYADGKVYAKFNVIFPPEIFGGMFKEDVPVTINTVTDLSDDFRSITGSGDFQSVKFPGWLKITFTYTGIVQECQDFGEYVSPTEGPYNFRNDN